VGASAARGVHDNRPVAKRRTAAARLILGTRRSRVGMGRAAGGSGPGEAGWAACEVTARSAVQCCPSGQVVPLAERSNDGANVVRAGFGGHAAAPVVVAPLTVPDACDGAVAPPCSVIAAATAAAAHVGTVVAVGCHRAARNGDAIAWAT
jgi:hypothetical protein